MISIAGWERKRARCSRQSKGIANGAETTAWLARRVLCCLVAFVLLADSGAIADLLFKVHAFPMGDKLVHFVLAGGMAALSVVTLCSYWPRRPLSAVGVASLAVGVGVTLEEFSNRWFEHRGWSLEDLAANYLGILCLGTLPALVWIALRAAFRPAADVVA